MVINGIDRIKISVRDLADSVMFFRNTMEMSLVAELQLEAASMQRLWNLPAGTTAKAAYLKNEEQPTLLELIEFEPNSGAYIRSDARNYDLGLFDVAFRAKNIDSIYKDLMQAGVEFVSRPVVYTADWANVKVKEVILIGPNRMPIALIERLSEPIPIIKNRFGTMVDSAQFVDDVDHVSAFYTEVLGYTSVFDKDLPEGLIDEVLDLPADTKSRMAFLLKPDTNTPAVELIRTSAPAKSLADKITPTNLGLFGWAFEVDDLAAFGEKVRAAGYLVMSGPVEMTVGAHGHINAVTVEGPNRMLLEFFET